jgi:hypothetical protein
MRFSTVKVAEMLENFCASADAAPGTRGEGLHARRRASRLRRKFQPSSGIFRRNKFFRRE